MKQLFNDIEVDFKSNIDIDLINNPESFEKVITRSNFLNDFYKLNSLDK